MSQDLHYNARLARTSYNLFGMPILNGYDYGAPALGELWAVPELIPARPPAVPMPSGPPERWRVARRGPLYILASEHDRDILERLDRIESSLRHRSIHSTEVGFWPTERPVVPQGQQDEP